MSSLSPSTRTPKLVKIDPVRQLAVSLHHRPIEIHRFDAPTLLGKPNDTVFIFAGIHGNEATTVYAAQHLLDLLSHDADELVPRGTSLVIIPTMNPDGYAANTRQNAAHVDLNRNFPSKNWRQTPHGEYWNGTAPLSEPESKALHDFVLELKPTRVMAMHSIRPPRHGNNYDGPAEPLAQLLASYNHYNVLPTIGYPTPGSFGSWAGIDLNIPTITLEFPSTLSGEKAWADNKDALLAFIRGK